MLFSFEHTTVSAARVRISSLSPLELFASWRQYTVEGRGVKVLLYRTSGCNGNISRYNSASLSFKRDRRSC